MSEGSFDMSAFPSLLSSNMNVLIRIQTPSMWLYFGTGSTCVVDSTCSVIRFGWALNITKYFPILNISLVEQWESLDQRRLVSSVILLFIELFKRWQIIYMKRNTSNAHIDFTYMLSWKADDASSQIFLLSWDHVKKFRPYIQTL